MQVQDQMYQDYINVLGEKEKRKKKKHLKLKVTNLLKTCIVLSVSAHKLNSSCEYE